MVSTISVRTLAAILSLATLAGAAQPEILRPDARVTIHLDCVPLADAVAFLEDSTGARLEPLWRSPAHAGLDPHRRVSLHADGATPTEAVERLLREAMPAAPGADRPTWQRAPDGAIQLGPRSRLNAFRRVEVYDVRDLLHIVPDFEEAPTLDLQAALARKAGGGSIFNEPTPEASWPTDQRSGTRDLAELVVEIVEPSQWGANGGDGATILALDGLLVVHAPGYIHRQIGR